MGASARLQSQHRRFELAGALDRARTAVALAGDAVEADRAGQPVAAGGREPRVMPAEAEAHREDGSAALAAEPLDCRAHVGLDPLRGRLLDVLHVLEVVVPLPHARRAAEVVDRDRRVAPLREPQRELLVEAVEPAHVREDRDACAGRRVGLGRERREPVAVGGLELELSVRDGSTGDDGDRRGRVELEAHAPSLLGPSRF